MSRIVTAVLLGTLFWTGWNSILWWNLAWFLEFPRVTEATRGLLMLGYLGCVLIAYGLTFLPRDK